LIGRPTFQEVIEAFEKLREKCGPITRELMGTDVQPCEILRLFLLQLVEERAASS
jgi:hypothetical protein